APGFQVEVAMPGYKPYGGGRRFALYEINVTLEDESNALASEATWKELSLEQSRASPTCRE
ncbi:MAG: hypothetical protein ABL931_11870, partial [Usitatibacteraceae bacterium]